MYLSMASKDVEDRNAVGKMEPKAIELQILPQSVYTGGDEVIGNIVLHRGTGREFSHVKLCFYGRTVHDVKGKYTGYVPRGPELFDISAAVHIKQGRTAAVGPMLWPFKLIFPANTQIVSQPFDYVEDKRFHNVHGHRLPPTIGLVPGWRGPVHRQIQYWVEAEAETVPFEGKVRTFTHRVELNYLPSRLVLSPLPCPSTQSEFFIHRLKKVCRESHIDPYASKGCKKCAQYPFTVCMSVPTQTYPGGPFPLNFSIDHKADIATAVEAPKIKVHKYRVALQAITEYRDDKEHNIKPRKTTVGVMEGKGTTMDLDKLFGKQGDLIPTFKTYDMARRYLLQVEVVAKCAKKKYPLQPYEVELEILSPLFRPALAQMAGPEPESKQPSVRRPSNRVPVYEVTPRNRVQDYRVSGLHDPTAFLCEQVKYEDESRTVSESSTFRQTVSHDHILPNGQQNPYQISIPNEDTSSIAELPVSTVPHAPTVLTAIPEVSSREDSPSIEETHPNSIEETHLNSIEERHPNNEVVPNTEALFSGSPSWPSSRSNEETPPNEQTLPEDETSSSDIPDFPPTRFNLVSPRDGQTFLDGDTSSSDIPSFPPSPSYEVPPVGIPIFTMDVPESSAAVQEVWASIGELPSFSPSPSDEVPAVGGPLLPMDVPESSAGVQEVRASIGELPSFPPSPPDEVPAVGVPILPTAVHESSTGLREVWVSIGELPSLPPPTPNEVPAVGVSMLPMAVPGSSAGVQEVQASLEQGETRTERGT